MRLLAISLIVAGVVLLAVKLLLDLLVPIGVVCLVLGVIFYYFGGETGATKVKILK